MKTITNRLIASFVACLAGPAYSHPSDLGREPVGDPGDAAFASLANLELTEVPTAEDRQARMGSNQSVAGKRQAGTMEEVIVTAQKREERLIDVPISVSVMSVDELVESGATQFRDFATTIPGLNYSTAGAGMNSVSMRGVANTVTSPTVAIYVDDVPYGSSTTFANGTNLSLDMGLFDLDRIEVLRGPQGTLYGASTMGGLLKYVTKRPNLQKSSVDAQTGVSSTRSGGISYNGAVTANLPIVSEKVGVRASGYYSHDGGFIDNTAISDSDINSSDVYGGRVDLLLNPAEALSVRVTGFLQNIVRDGQALSDRDPSGKPLDGELDARRLLPEPFDQRFRLVSATINYDFGKLLLTSASSYQTLRSDFFGDLSYAYLPLMELYFDRSYGALGYTNDVSTDKFTQEIRLASDLANSKLEWRLGGFFTRETARYAQEIVPFDSNGQLAPKDILTYSNPSEYEEYAAFGDMTWRIVDHLDVTGGIRYARTRQEFEQSGSGLFGASLNTPPRSASDEVPTYLANARYHFSDDATAYLRYATGYRPGGPNYVAIDPGTGLPVGDSTFEPDRLKSYEIGYKAQLDEGRYGVDMAGYYIDWSNTQVSIVQGGLGGIGNAQGGATVRGAELALTANLGAGLTAIGTFAYQDAKLSENESALGGAKDERLPGIPRVTATLSADYKLSLDDFEPTLGATLQYTDERPSTFGNAYVLPEYTILNVRAGVVLGRFNAQLYVRNVFDERGQVSGGTSLASPLAINISQPRTIGVVLTTRL